MEETESPASSIVPTAESNSNDNPFMYGEHVVSVWYNDNLNRLDWHLGVVDSVVNEDVSNMIQTDKKGLKWLFLEEADLQNTKHEQIIVNKYDS